LQYFLYCCRVGAMSFQMNYFWPIVIWWTVIELLKSGCQENLTEGEGSVQLTSQSSYPVM